MWRSGAMSTALRKLGAMAMAMAMAMAGEGPGGGRVMAARPTRLPGQEAVAGWGLVERGGVAGGARWGKVRVGVWGEWWHLVMESINLGLSQKSLN